MDIKAEINWLHKEIDQLQDPGLIEALKDFLF